MSIQHMPCASGRLAVALVNSLLRSPFAPNLDVAAERIQKSRDSMNLFGNLMPVATGVGIRQQTLDGVDCVLHQPDNAPANRVLIYFHGGGYCLGSPQSHRHIVSRLAQETGVRAIVPNYRKSPEHPFPAPVLDAIAVYRAVLDQGIKPQNIYLAGDSAGGNLVLEVLLKLKSRSLPMPAAGCCISPWTDLTMSGESIHSKADVDVVLSEKLLQDFADCYCRGINQGIARNDPELSPLFADLSGLPPLMIQVGSDEVLLDDSLRLAERAKAAAVDVRLQVWERMQHVWHYSFLFLKDARLAISEIADFFNQVR